MSNENKWYADLWIIKLLSVTLRKARDRIHSEGSKKLMFSSNKYYTYSLSKRLNSVTASQKQQSLPDYLKNIEHESDYLNSC